MDDIQAKTEELIAAILLRSDSMNEHLGLMVLTATQFVGAGAAVLERLSEKKNGPQLDTVGWAEEVTKLIIRECKKQLRH